MRPFFSASTASGGHYWILTGIRGNLQAPVIEPIGTVDVLCRPRGFSLTRLAGEGSRDASGGESVGGSAVTNPAVPVRPEAPR